MIFQPKHNTTAFGCGQALFQTFVDPRESIVVGGFRFKVVRADSRRVRLLQVERIDQPAGGSDVDPQAQSRLTDSRR